MELVTHFIKYGKDQYKVLMNTVTFVLIGTMSLVEMKIGNKKLSTILHRYNLIKSLVILFLVQVIHL